MTRGGKTGSTRRPVWLAIFGGLSQSFELAFCSWLSSARLVEKRGGTGQGGPLNSLETIMLWRPQEEEEHHIFIT